MVQTISNIIKLIIIINQFLVGHNNSWVKYKHFAIHGRLNIHNQLHLPNDHRYWNKTVFLSYHGTYIQNGQVMLTSSIWCAVKSQNINVSLSSTVTGG